MSWAWLQIFSGLPAGIDAVHVRPGHRYAAAGGRHGSGGGAAVWNCSCDRPGAAGADGPAGRAARTTVPACCPLPPHRSSHPWPPPRAVISLLLIWYSTKPSPGGRHAHDQATGIGAQNHVAGGIQRHRPHVRFVALVQHAAVAIRRDAMDRARIARGHQQVARFVERQGPDIFRFRIVEDFAICRPARPGRPCHPAPWPHTRGPARRWRWPESGGHPTPPASSFRHWPKGDRAWRPDRRRHTDCPWNRAPAPTDMPTKCRRFPGIAAPASPGRRCAGTDSSDCLFRNRDSRFRSRCASGKPEGRRRKPGDRRQQSGCCARLQAGGKSAKHRF